MKCHGCGEVVRDDETRIALVEIYWDTATPYCEECYFDEPLRARLVGDAPKVVPGDPTSEGSMFAIEDILCDAGSLPSGEIVRRIRDVVVRWAETWEEGYTIN